ncbi:MAG: radical SAM protein, partial [Saprospiraceae bacterium]
ILEKKMKQISPKLVAISVPFPGNLLSAFRCAQWIKKNYPDIKIAMGGGFANTELRSVSEPRVFEFFDFITLDDGELPIECLVNYCNSNPNSFDSDHEKDLSFDTAIFKRTFTCIDGQVKYINNAPGKDYPMAQLGTPDYSDLLLEDYISVIEIVNPMHRMWSDGRWNKLTLAHGCYWGKCTFCDISLDYIKVYEPLTASLLCDRMEEMIKQTGQNGFHFVDEAAPPARMRDLAFEILKRKLSVSWWTNIRFEKSFNRDLCKLLKASGCIAISGGLEVASDRLLELIQKGVTVAQVAQVCNNFTESGILVHAYLMYGFPTQTAQETIDSLEMVRQLFEARIIQSGFWHQFAMTVHSPVGMFPEEFKVQKINHAIGAFANNDLDFHDPAGVDHDAFSYGLKKSLLNYMHGLCLDYRLQEWFDFKIPKDKIQKNYIQNVLQEKEPNVLNASSKVVWIGNKPQLSEQSNEKGEVNIILYENRKTIKLSLGPRHGAWLLEILEMISPQQSAMITLKQLKEMYESAGLDRFDLFWDSAPIGILKKNGLLVL